MQQQIFDEIRRKTDFIGLSETSKRELNIRLLDYACGTGLVSRALAPYVTSTTGIDLSENMTHKFNEVFSPSSELKPECEGHAVVANLLSDSPSPTIDDAKFRDFDIAAIGLGFHHFADPQLAIQRLVQRLKKETGVLMIIDWLPGSDPSGHGHHHSHGHGHPPGSAQDEKWPEGAKPTIGTNGFSEEDMQKMFEAAGCVNFGFSPMKEPVELWVGEGDDASKKVKTVFIARGRRAG